MNRLHFLFSNEHNARGLKYPWEIFLRKAVGPPFIKDVCVCVLYTANIKFGWSHKGLKHKISALCSHKGELEWKELAF